MRRPSCVCLSALQCGSLVGIDRDAFGLGFFRHDTDQIDVEQAAVKRCALHFDVIGQTERQLERPLGDALVQVGDVLRLVLAAAASDGEYATLYLQIEVRLLETGGCHHDAILIVAVLLDVVGRVRAAGVVTQGRLEQVVEAVEAHGLPEQRGHGE